MKSIGNIELQGELQISTAYARNIMCNVTQVENSRDFELTHRMNHSSANHANHNRSVLLKTMGPGQTATSSSSTIRS